MMTHEQNATNRRAPRAWLTAALLVAALSGVLACESGPMNVPVAQPPSFTHEEAEDSVVSDDTGKQFKLVEGSFAGPRREVSDWIGKNGGTLFLEAGRTAEGHPYGHFLIVPKGAVTQSTLFTMRANNGHFVHVHLRAQVPISRKSNELVDVGAQGFPEPIILAMSYTGAVNLDGVDPSRLTVIYDPEQLGATVRRTRGFVLPPEYQYVLAYLDHFSKYVVAFD